MLEQRVQAHSAAESCSTINSSFGKLVCVGLTAREVSAVIITAVVAVYQQDFKQIPANLCPLAWERK